VRLDICEYLLKNGARIDIEDKIKKQTPMQFAKSKNKRAVIDLPLITRVSKLLKQLQSLVRKLRFRPQSNKESMRGRSLKTFSLQSSRMGLTTPYLWKSTTNS